jgi:hypothetical protein
MSASDWHWNQVIRLRRHQAELDSMLSLFDYGCTEVRLVERLKSSFAELEAEQIQLFDEAQNRELDIISQKSSCPFCRPIL